MEFFTEDNARTVDRGALSGEPEVKGQLPVL